MAIRKKPKYDRICPQGKTYTDRYGLLTKQRNPIDYTGYSARIEIRSVIPDDDSTPGDDDVILSISTDDYITIDEHIVTIVLPPSITAALDVGTYWWELELISPSGEIPYFMSPSKFKVVSEVTLND